MENNTPRRLKTKASPSRSKAIIRKASSKAILGDNSVLDSIVASVLDGGNADNKLDVEVLVKDMAINSDTFRATIEDLEYILG